MNAPARSSDRDALLRQAMDLRLARRAPEALRVLDRLQALHPRFSRMFHERGHCHVLLGDAPAAISALVESVNINPAFPASWDMLAQLHRLQGDAAQADMAAQQLALLQQLPQEIVVANSLLADGDLTLAEDVVRDFLERDGNNVGALRLLARICLERDAPAEAESLLMAALELAPDYHAARLDYAMVLLQQQKHLAARTEAERLLQHDPDDRDYLKQYGAACIGLGDHEAVVDLYARLLAGPCRSQDEVADLRLWRANALKIIGRRPEAISDYRAALEARPDYGVAWFSFANLKTYRFSDDEIARMEAVLVRPDTQPMDRVYLCFALGKAQEDRADYATSWRYYARGNALRRDTSRDRPGVAKACAERLRQTFSAQFFAERAGWGASDPSPIFILGLPRSGSTLIEQILASHSRVEGTQELIEIDQYAAALCGRDPDCGLPLAPEALQALSARDARALGERFLSDTLTYRRLGRPFFIDKTPGNFWHVGLIHLILPHARIIDVRRAPMSCGFSNLKQLFGGANQEFSYGIDSFAERYRVYLELMRHWDAVLPGRVLRVHYEDVVEDLEGGVGRILSHCGLSFEETCLTFHQTRRSVRTPSSEQVRQPISRHGVDQWRNYAPWLEPLRDALGPALTDYRS